MALGGRLRDASAEVRYGLFDMDALGAVLTIIKAVLRAVIACGELPPPTWENNLS
jgi:hypothetical protein